MENDRLILCQTSIQQNEKFLYHLTNFPADDCRQVYTDYRETVTGGTKVNTGSAKKGLIFLLLVSREASKGLAGFRATFGRVEVELESNTLLELLQRVSLRVVVLLLRVAWEGES